MPPFPSPQSPTPTIKTSWSGGYLCVPVAKDGGAARRFLLDTGTDKCYLTPKGFARMKAAGGVVAPDGTMTVSGLAVGGVPLPPVVFAPEARGYPKLSVEGNADGFLGTDALENFRLGLNLSKNEVALFPLTVPVGTAVQEWLGPALAKHGDKGLYDVMPLASKAQRYAVWVDVDNIGLPMVADTGSPLTFVRSDFLPYLRGAERAHGDEARYFGGTLKYDQLRVGWVGLRFSRLGGPRRIAGMDPKVGYPGILGRDAMTPLVMLFDYAGGNVYLTDAEGRSSPTVPTRDPIEALVMPSLVVRYPAGGPVHLPPGSTAHLPEGTLEILNADGSLDLLPPTTVWPGGPAPDKPGDRPGGPPPFTPKPGNKARWYPGIGWTEIPNSL